MNCMLMIKNVMKICCDVIEEMLDKELGKDDQHRIT